WQDIALENKFWTKSEIVPIGSVMMDQAIKHTKKPDTHKKDTLDILYLSGDIQPTAVKKYLEEFLRMAPANIQLKIKLHPRENLHNNIFIQMKNHGKTITVLHQNDPTIEHILSADIVIGTSTSAMIE